MDSSALSSLDVLSKACQYVATQDSQETGAIVTPSPIPSYMKPAVKAPTRDVQHNRAHAKDTPNNNKPRENHATVDNHKSADIKREQENVAHDQPKEINSRKAYPDKAITEINTKNKIERNAPPPPYQQSIDKSEHQHGAKYSYANGVSLTASELEAKAKEADKMIEDLSNHKNKRRSSGEKSVPQSTDGLPPYSTTVNSFNGIKTKTSDSQELRMPDKWPTGVPPYMLYPELAAAANVERMYGDIQNLPHDVKLLDVAYAMRAGATALPQLPENFQRLLYPGINPLAFAQRDLTTGLPTTYPGLQSEHLAAPLLQAQLSYAADQKRLYESLQQGFHPQTAQQQQYLNSILMSSLQDPKSGNSAAAAAALYQRPNPGIVFPVPGYWLPQNFPYSGEGGIKLPEITTSGILPRHREESPRNLLESGIGTPPIRHPQAAKMEEQMRSRQSPFSSYPPHAHGMSEQTRPKVREESSPKPKPVNNSTKHNLISQSRYNPNESNIKQETIRRYELMNAEVKENGVNKYASNFKAKPRTTQSPSVPLSTNSSPGEHLREINMDKRINHSPRSDTPGRGEAVAASAFPGLKFPGQLGLVENGLTSVQLAALQQQAIITQQLAMGGQLNHGSFPAEFLAGHYNNLSQIVPNLATLSPHSTASAVHSQADSIRYSLVDSPSRQNGIHENRSSSASSVTPIAAPKPAKIRRSSPNSDHAIMNERYGFDSHGKYYISPGSIVPDKIKTESNGRKEGHRPSHSPHLPFQRFENGFDKKIRSGKEQEKPPSYPENYRPSSESEAVDSPSNKRKKTSSEPPAPSIEEHFRRSLGKNYVEPEAEKKVQITGTVDDHFKKSLGDMWSNFQGRPHSASPDTMKQRSSDYPPPFIRSTLLDMRRPYNGNPPPYKNQHDPTRKRELPIDATNSNNIKPT